MRRERWITEKAQQLVADGAGVSRISDALQLAYMRGFNAGGNFVVERNRKTFTGERRENPAGEPQS
jgi:hypothetical protein